MSGDVVYCNGEAIQLTGRGIERRLFEVFMQNLETPLMFDEIASYVYEIDDFASKSKAFRQTTRENIAKLLSRARWHASAATNGLAPPWIDWFPYNGTEGTWELYRLRNHHIKMLDKHSDCAAVLEYVSDQTHDEGLWYKAVTAPEAYLQNALRKLHLLIEERLDS